MNFNTISYTLFLYFVMVMFFPIMIYAWTVRDPPIRPSIGTKKNCVQWIVFNGFTAKNIRLNRRKAIDRDHDLDKKASTWAAMYAFKIGGKENLYEISPIHFCQQFPGYNDKKEFVALEDESRYCEDWITLYGFSEDSQNFNSTYALNIFVKEGEGVVPIYPPFSTSNMALWAYFYYIYMVKYGKQYFFTPTDFCSRLGKNVGENRQLMPFMCENDTYMTCEAWIKLYEFKDDPEYNYEKSEILDKSYCKYHIRVQYFAATYANKLIRLGIQKQPINLTPQAFCKLFDGDGAEPQEYNLEVEKKTVPQDEASVQ